MIFLDYLRKRSQRSELSLPAIPAISDQNKEYVDPEDEADYEAGIYQCESEIDLASIFCVIDYEDAKGNFSRRRITAIKLQQGVNAPILVARCHERNALRHFRLDRIDCFISEDGEVVDTKTYFDKIFGIDMPDYSAGGTRETQDASRKYWPKARPIESLPLYNRFGNALTSSIAILVTVARTDGIHPTETAAILNYIEDNLNLPPNRGRYGSVSAIEIDALEVTIGRLRPRSSSFGYHIASLAAFRADEMDLFRRSLRSVIHADGKISAEEIEVFDNVISSLNER